MPDYGIRVREFTTPTKPGRVLPTHNTTLTNVAGDATVLTFNVSQDVAGALSQPLYAGIEVRGPNGWVTPDDNLFIAYEDTSEDAEAGRFVSFTAVSWVADKLQKHHLDQLKLVDHERHFKAASPGKVMAEILDEHILLGVDRTFTATHDSNGTPWPTADISDHTFRELTSLDAVLASLTGGAFCEWHTRGTALELVVAGSGVDRSSGAGTIKMGPGAASVRVTTSIDETATDFIIVSDQEDVPWQFATRPEIGAGRREAVITVAGATTAAAAMRAALPTIDAMSVIRREVTVMYDAGKLPARPFVDFNIGDVLRVKSRGSWENRRVVGVQIQVQEKGTTVRITFDERFLTLSAKLAGRMSQVSVGSVGGTAGNGSAIPPTKVIVNGTPAAPSSIAVTSNVGRFRSDGSAVADIVLDWPSISQTVDGVNTVVTEYDVWIRRPDGPSARLTLTPDSTATLDLAGGAIRSVKARAFNGKWSAFSPETVVTAALPPLALAVPTKPDLTAGLSTVAVAWDGLLGGFAPVDGFRRVLGEYRFGTSGSFTRLATTVADAGQVGTVPAKPGQVLQVRLIAEDTLGRKSTASAVTQLTIPAVQTVDLDAAINDAIDKAVQDSGTALSEVEKAIATSLDEYVVTSSSTVAPPADAAWSSDTPDWVAGQYVWRRTKNTHIDGSVTYSAPAVITGADGQAGEDAVLLRVSSTRGTSFKNNAISTVLTVTVFKGSLQITNITDLHAQFGTSAYLEWWWRRIDDTEFGVLSSADSRLSQAGFALTVSPADVDEQTVFQCILHT